MKSINTNILKDELTPKELEIIQLMSEGKLYKEICIIQNITLDTVKKHASTVYKKLKVRNRTEALIKLATKNKS